MKKFEWKWRQKCNHPQCDKRAGYGKRDFSLWSVAALDEKYCLEQLQGEAGNTLYFVRLCETGAHVFFSLSFSFFSLSLQHIFPLVCLVQLPPSVALICILPSNKLVCRLPYSWSVVGGGIQLFVLNT